MDMRGLSNFIRDIREATSSREAEFKRVAQELGKIRAKFKDSNAMTPYDRKKYVCKLLFIFMLGYEVDFGHMEAVELLAGQSASEKLIGYLAISVLLHENHPLLMLTTHTVTVDLAKGAELQKTLALTAIANVGSKENVDSFVSHVVSCLTSRTVSIPVRKRSILAALHLFRKQPQSLDISEVGPVISAFVSSNDFAVATCAAAFADELLRNKDTREHMLGTKSAALTKLTDIIVDRRTPPEYVQYQVPAPWLQVKLLRLLQHFPPPRDEEEANKMSLILCKIIKASEKVISEVQHQMSFKRGANSNRSNLFVATLVEAVSLCILWDCDAVALGHCREALGVLIGDKRDPNVKSLGLLMLSRMSFCSSYNFSEHVIGEYQATVVQALHDRDNSVRLRALDLLNAMCNKDNAANIVGELQEYLKVAHPSIREDLVLLIAVLAEKFCAEVTWYVEVLMLLLEEAGQFIPEDVWHRLVHIVVNTPSVQKHSVALLMRVLTGGGASTTTSSSSSSSSATSAASSSGESEAHKKGNNNNVDDIVSCSEVVVLVGSLLLGEFGYQIALLPGSGPADQLHALHSKWHNISEAARSTMLTTFAKFYNLYDDPVTRDRIIKIFSSAKTALDCEVQTRATEYHILVTQCSDDILLAALEPLPDFDVAADTLVARLRERHHGQGAADHWSQKAEERDARQMRESNVVKPTAGVSVTSTTTTTSSNNNAVNATNAATAAAGGEGSSSSSEGKAGGFYDDLFDNKPSAPVSSSSSSSQQPASSKGNPDKALQDCKNIHLPSLLSGSSKTGRLLEDPSVVTLDVTTFDCRGADVRCSIKLTPQTESIQALSVQVGNSTPGLLVQMQPVTTTSLKAKESVTVNFAARAQSTFSASAASTINVSFLRGTSNNNNWTANGVPLPIALSSFVEPYKTEEVQKFQGLWESLGSNTAVQSSQKKEVLSGVSNGISAVEKRLASAAHLHCFRASGRSDICFAMGALALQPGDTAQFTPVLAVAQEAPNQPGNIAVMFRSVDANASDVAHKRFVESGSSGASTGAGGGLSALF